MISPEYQIQQAQRAIRPDGTMCAEAGRLDDAAARLMAVQRLWNQPERAALLADALAASRGVWHDIQGALARGALTVPVEVQHNLLILSVYADSRIEACEAAPSVDALGSLVALTRTLAGSLKQWQEAA